MCVKAMNSRTIGLTPGMRRGIMTALRPSKERLPMSEPTETIRVQFNYPLDRVKEPILYRLVADYGLIPNVRRANIDVHIGGFIQLDLTGEPRQLAAGIDWLKSCGITITSEEVASDRTGTA